LGAPYREVLVESTRKYILKIDKIISITDIGRFKNFYAKGPSGDLSSVSLIYGQNGSGKSTLASIFSSLEGEARNINKRERVGEKNPTPKISIRVDKSVVNYSTNKGWDKHNLNISVFDSSFINDNIYSGESIFKEQRASLFLLLFLDEEGRTLHQEAEKVNSEVAEVNRKLSAVIYNIMESSGLNKQELFEYISPTGVLKKEHTGLRNLFENKEFKGLIERYASLTNERFVKTALIKEKKQEILVSAESVLNVHQDNVNKYLQILSANFRIANIGLSNFSNDMSQRLKYSIRINDCEENIFDSNTVKHGKPYFDTLLSDADKRTISFAFFMSKIESDKNISSKIVVFDDPMSSFDSARKTATKQAILALSTKVSQVIILSHDINFLASFWLDSKVKSPSLIEVKKTASFVSELKEWNIASDYDSEFIKNYKLLHLFVDGESVCQRSVALTIRVALEEYFRQKFPINFVKKEWLGDFLKKVRESDQTSNLFAMKKHLDELSFICEYASPFHHAPQPEIIEDELMSYVKRTIVVLQA